MKEINPLKLASTKGFDQEFTRLISEPGVTHKSAFHQLNEAYEEATGHPRYSDYDSYRIARSRRLRSR